MLAAAAAKKGAAGACRATKVTRGCPIVHPILQMSMLLREN